MSSSSEKNRSPSSTRLDPLKNKPEEPIRWPAEWEKQDALWLSWPQNNETWSPVRGKVEPCYQSIIEAVLPRQRLHLLVDDVKTRDELRKKFEQQFSGDRGSLLENFADNLEILIRKTNDSWIRDYGALSAYSGTKPGFMRKVMIDFGFNSWGGKYPPFDADNAVGTFMAEVSQVERFPLDFILEGGSIDGNGAGSLLTTKQCLLNENRNPQYKQGEIEEILHRWLGIDTFIWLESGIEGDDTDGHIDDLARFLTPSLVFAAVETSKSDENYQALKRNMRELEQYAGRMNLEVVELPMPDLLMVEGLRTPASYTNFLFINDAVLVPVFKNKRDEHALELFEKHLPKHQIIPIDCRALVFGQGAIHCSSMQECATIQ